MDLTRAAEIFDGTTWYYGLEPGSVKVDKELGIVSFVINWKRTDRRPAKRDRITLRIDQVCGMKESLTAR